MVPACSRGESLRGPVGFGSLTVLVRAIAGFKGATSPQLARSIQATGNVWELKPSTECTPAWRLPGLSNRINPAVVSRLTSAAGELIGIKRGNR